MKRRMTEHERKRLSGEHRSWMRMIFEQTIYGAVIGVLIAFLIMQFDVNRIGTMIANSDHRLGFTVLMMFGFALTFGMVAGGAAIWFRAVMESDD